MKRLTLALLPLAIASAAHASGVALRWDSCQGPSNRNFACDRSTGTEVLVGSFSPPGGTAPLSGIEMVLRISSADGSTPSWWQMFQHGSCRQTSLSSSFDFSDQVDCDSPWTDQATGAVAKYQIDGMNGVDVWMIAAVPAGAARNVNPGTTYAAFKLLINHQRSSGAGACAGCRTPMCIRLEAIRLAEALGPMDPVTRIMPTRTDVLTDGISGLGGSSQVATWQGGTPSCGAGTSRPSTWSELKDRFRSR